jgi:opacity protein-like surface antigen
MGRVLGIWGRSATGDRERLRVHEPVMRPPTHLGLAGCFPGMTFTMLVLATAHAQVVATPYLHANFGEVELRRGGWGLFAGYLGRRLGFELDVDRHHHFFKDAKLESVPNPCMPGAPSPCVDSDTDAWLFLGNVVAPIPLSSRWRPYGSAGLGVIYAWVHEAGEYDTQQTDLAVHTGGGVMYQLTDWLALRADLHYLHAFVDDDAREGVYYDDYDFGRLALGVTFAPARLGKQEPSE